MIRYRYTSEGFLAIPVSSLGNEYIVAGWNVDAMFRAVWNYKLPNITTITAAYDDTRVRFTLGGNPNTKTAGGMKPGESKEFILNKGDVWAVAADTDEGDLSGSKIIANKPVAVVTGNMCANIPTGNQWCDYIAEMDLPLYLWGNDILVPKIPGRKYPSIIRIFAKKPNTTIYKNGIQIGQIKQAGGMEENAFLTMRMGPMDVPPASVVISGDKPIGITLYNTGVQEDNYVQSDPFMMAMIPLQNFIKEITFATPGIMGGQAFAMNWVNLVYETDELGNMPDDVEFAKVNSGKYEWEKLKTKYPAPDEVFTYKVNGKKFAVKTLTLPGDGVYKIKANSPIAAYAFGYDSYDSYGYPLNMALPDIEDQKDTVPPVITYEIYKNKILGEVKDMPDDPRVRTNLSYITLDDAKSNNIVLKYIPFNPGEHRSTNWELEPEDETKDAYGYVVFSDVAGNITEFEGTIKAQKVLLSTYDIDFGSMHQKSGKQNQIVKITNNSATETIELSLFELIHGNQNISFDISSLPNDMKIAPKEFAEFTVWFNPVEQGDFIDTIRITTVDNYQLDLSVKAKVIGDDGTPVIFASNVNFGTIEVGDTYTKKVKIDNQGEGDLRLLGYNSSKNNAFIIGLPPTDDDDLFATPIIIKPNETFNFYISFSPKEEGTYNETVNYITNSTSLKDYTVLTGKAELVNSIEDNENKYAEIYPNPANKQLNIRLQDASKLPKLIDIVNTKGDVIYSINEVTQRRITLNTENLSIGSYYLRLLTSDGSSRIVKKFTITR